MSFFVRGTRPGEQVHAEANAMLIDPEAAEAVRTGAHSLVTLLAPGSQTDGRFGLFRYDMGPRSMGPGPHIHTRFSESFYVLSGEVTLFDGEAWVAAGPGRFLHVPEYGVHGFRNDGDEPASFLILFAPGTPREEFFRDMAELASSGRRLSADEMAELYRRHDQYMVDVRRDDEGSP